MSFWYTQPTPDPPSSVGLGEAPLSSIFTAARDAGVLANNQNSAIEALTRAYDERIKAIEDATGERLVNPMRTISAETDTTYTQLTAGSTVFERDLAPAMAEKRASEFQRRLQEIGQRYPDKAQIIGADRPVERDAEALARHSEERLANAIASRDGIGKWAALFAGSAVGAAYDPMQVGTWIFGGGPGAARTVAGRVLTTFATEAVTNAFSEAIVQPEIQAWRKQAGLPNGMDEALNNVAYAGILGGVLGAGVHGAGEGISKIFGKLDVESIARAETSSPDLRAAILDGDARAAARLLQPLGGKLPPEARGAIASIELDQAINDAKPVAATVSHHEEAVSAAIHSAQSNTPFHPDPDPVQVKRIVDQLVPETVVPASAPAKASGEMPLDQFLMRKGGVQDYKGELKALGLEKRSERFIGKLVRENGRPLDDARLIAAEAGYFDHLYGTPEAAAEKSTVSDLLDALDSGARQQPTIRETVDDSRIYAEALVHDLARMAGPAVDDHLILQAAHLANAEGLPPAEALDRVLIADDEARAVNQSPAYSPEEHIGGLDDPMGFPPEDYGNVQQELAAIDPDFEIPFFDDEKVMTASDLAQDLERRDNLVSVVKACKI